MSNRHFHSHPCATCIFPLFCLVLEQHSKVLHHPGPPSRVKGSRASSQISLELHLAEESQIHPRSSLTSHEWSIWGFKALDPSPQLRTTLQGYPSFRALRAIYHSQLLSLPNPASFPSS